MIHGVVAQLMAFVYHARQHIRYLGDTLADHQKRSNCAALLEAVHDPVQADALFQRAAGSVLHDRAVGHGIGERHADFDHVRAVGVQFFNDAPERVERGEACGDEGNERRASGCVRIPYFCSRSHDGSPRYASGGKVATAPLTPVRGNIPPVPLFWWDMCLRHFVFKYLFEIIFYILIHRYVTIIRYADVAPRCPCPCRRAPRG